jgi:hypothetical protein
MCKLLSECDKNDTQNVIMKLFKKSFNFSVLFGRSGEISLASASSEL